MVGGIIIAVLLLVIFPVAIILSSAMIASMLGSSAKMSVDAKHAGSEALKLSQTNFYDGSTQRRR